MQSSVTESSWVGYDTWYKKGCGFSLSLCNCVISAPLSDAFHEASCSQLSLSATGCTSAVCLLPPCLVCLLQEILAFPPSTPVFLAKSVAALRSSHISSIHPRGWKRWPISSDSSHCYCTQLLCIAAAPGQCGVTRLTQCSQEDFGASNHQQHSLKSLAKACPDLHEIWWNISPCNSDDF